MADEVHQCFVFGRSGRMGDVILDTLSAIMLIVLVRSITDSKSGQ